MKRIYVLLVCGLFAYINGYSQNSSEFTSSLEMEEIMKGDEFVGTSPSQIRWSLDNKKIFFSWRQKDDEINKPYIYEYNTGKLRKADENDLKDMSVSNVKYNTDRNLAVFERAGDLYLYDFKKNKELQLTDTPEREYAPQFIKSDKEVAFRKGNQLYSIALDKAVLKQLSNISEPKTEIKSKSNQQKDWLKQQQEMFDVLTDIKTKKDAYSKLNMTYKPKSVKNVEVSKQESVWGISVNSNATSLSYLIRKPISQSEFTEVHNYVTETGYVENIRSRSKVGHDQAQYRLIFQDIKRDTILIFNTEILPGIADLPDYLNDYPERKKELEEKKEARAVNYSNVQWNESGTHALFSIYSQDNKDRWIVLYDSNKLKFDVVDRQRDEAWIGGPGILSYSQNLAWINAESFYYQSEKTGYSHLYVYNLKQNKSSALTSGNYEVQEVRLSNDKESFYISTNEEHPGITHYYKLRIKTKAKTQLTKERGGHQVFLSPDEKAMAILYSNSTSPWELYVQPNSPKALKKQITQSTTEEFESYDWREPEMVTFENRNGKTIHARVYNPEVQHPNRPAVVFVHGAGYLQNVHYWWSSYHREYMFHNMLADMGYVVIDIDYTASKGYGRDIRTGIYRHMGGEDLTDQVDGVKYLVDNYNVNPSNVGIYGGSYGGFITLMALFNEADVFKSGAALRSVTDWAHYNHGYTSNILNLPYEDPIAYEQSSPIYFADGLKGNLLMAHGVIDVNVQFQDIVRLSQRLIELEKDNWELAVYPLEDHGFVHTTSWIDEYKRILKLFETTLKK